MSVTMRRVCGSMLLVGLLAAMLPGPAVADDLVTDDGAVVLAVEGEPVGPDPKPRESEDNPARELAGYENPDVPFTWGAAWILTFTSMVGLVLLAGLYWLGVHRPSRGAS